MLALAASAHLRQAASSLIANQSKMNLNNNYAAIASGAIIAMAIAAGFSYDYVWNTLIDFSDPVQTVENLQKATFLFKTGIASWLFIALCDVVVAWALYLLWYVKGT
jgi:putative flippase GtrA